ncbi:MAG: HEAT repeat domain-containing protein [Methanomicrobiales archaeon]|nr:HEAT repeat domain-containing protein [Methanomicrobiales archaeon]NYT20460.1 HEAT repeat domain-containing protein [Methanomicrobiales archaeon]
MSLAEVYRMKNDGNVAGLVAALADDDEYVRRAAVQALAGFPDARVREILERMRFEDPVALVRTAATLAHARVTAALLQKEER